MDFKELASLVCDDMTTFNDNDGSTVLVLWNFDEFKNKYNQLTSKYEKKDLTWSWADWWNFYNELEEIIDWEIAWFITI